MSRFDARDVLNEHFVPAAGLDLEPYIQRLDLTAIHHLVRYRWAIEVLRVRRGIRVVDVGCGAGYGAFEIASAYPDSEVVGIDYDPSAIRQAEGSFHRPNLRFVTGDPLVWETVLGADPFDAVVCFDVIEHVEHRELLMENIVRHLKEDGRLLFSTPSGMPENNLKPEWEFHRIEYGTASLYDFLRRYFSSVVGSQEADFPGRAVFEDLHARGVDYLLRLNPVICSRPIRIANPFRAE
jgi:cyclopropane fatty-acyl-phospholipid synthase-like methyltransferase